MYQKQDKLISVRMTSDLVDKLDAVAARFGYYKRSDVLRAFASQIFNDLSESEILEIMRNLTRARSQEKVLRMHNPGT